MQRYTCTFNFEPPIPEEEFARIMRNTSRETNSTVRVYKGYRGMMSRTDVGGLAFFTKYSNRGDVRCFRKLKFTSPETTKKITEYAGEIMDSLQRTGTGKPDEP